MATFRKQGEMSLRFDFGQASKQFKSFSKSLDIIKKEAFEIGKEYLREVSEKFILRLQDVIQNQEIAWEPLSEKYLQWKIKNELDDRTLIATGQYVESFTASEQDQGNIFIVTVEIADEEHEMTGINLRVLGRILEFGSYSRNIPPRPHWRPVISEFLKDRDIFSREATDRIISGITKRLSR